MIDIFALFNQDNPFLYNPEDNDCDENENKWREVCKEVCNNEIDISEIWNVMRTKCKDIRDKLPQNVGNFVDVTEHYTSNTFKKTLKIIVIL